jgi:hypothetical protein
MTMLFSMHFSMIGTVDLADLCASGCWRMYTFVNSLNLDSGRWSQRQTASGLVHASHTLRLLILEDKCSERSDFPSSEHFGTQNLNKFFFDLSQNSSSETSIQIQTF